MSEETVKLGKLPYTPKSKDLKYSTYKSSTIPPIPASFGHQDKIANWGMLGNDSLGDCVVAGACHAAMLWTLEGEKPATFTPTNAISDYSSACGYDPLKPNTDRGCYIRNVLDYQRNVGVIDSSGVRHKIGAFLALDLSNLTEVFEAIYLFSVVKIGFIFPSSAMSQFYAGLPWTVVDGSTINGAHDVEIIGYDKDWLYVVTWGKVQKMSFEFYQKYCDEAWVALSSEMLNGSGLSPEGFNLTQLQADLDALNNPEPKKVYTLTTTPDKQTYNTGDLINLNIHTSIPSQSVSCTFDRPGIGIFSPTIITDANGNYIMQLVMPNAGTLGCDIKWLDPNNETQEVKLSILIIIPKPPDPDPTKLYHVLTKPFKKIEDANAFAKTLNDKGMSTYAVISIQCGAFGVKENADKLQAQLKVLGIDSFIAQY